MKRAKKTVDQWIKSGHHLPTWMRDFHDQKDLFKACEAMMGRGYGEGSFGSVAWTDAQMYTIDKFLRFMAIHGIALRAARKDAPSIEDAVRKHSNERRDMFMSALKATRKEGAVE